MMLCVYFVSRENCVDKANETRTGSSKDTRISTDVLTVQELEELPSEEPEAPVNSDSDMTLINVKSSNASNSAGTYVPNSCMLSNIIASGRQVMMWVLLSLCTDPISSDKGIPFLPSDLER